MVAATISRSKTTVVLIAAALAAFAGNSLLCRLALADAAMDPASYTAVRLFSGALTLWLIGAVGDANRPSGAASKSWRPAALLFLYAIAFSYAYRGLSAGTGALILFASVQLTMIAAALTLGEAPSLTEWCGWLLAMAGLIYLLLPGIAAPSLSSSLLMITAGVAWGGYSLLGRRVANPIRATAENFQRALPLALVWALFQLPLINATTFGLVLATLSGALTSGLGYVVWYAVLARVSATQAATVQLLVPVLAGFGGVALLSERITPRLVIAAVTILGGIGLSSLARQADARDCLFRPWTARMKWRRA